MILLCVDFIASSSYNICLTLLYCTNLLFSNDYKKNDKIIHKYFKAKYVKSRV